MTVLVVLQIHHLLDILYGKSLTTKYVRFDKVPPSCDQDSAADADAAAAESPMAKRPKMEEGVLDSVQPSGYIKVWKTWWQRAGDGEKSSKQPNFYVNFVLKKRLVVNWELLKVIVMLKNVCPANCILEFLNNSDDELLACVLQFLVNNMYWQPNTVEVFHRLL